jgi:hypothetical protein
MEEQFNRIVGMMQSNDITIQKDGLQELITVLFEEDKQLAERLIGKLNDVAPTIHHDNVYSLFNCLALAYEKDQDSIEPILLNELERWGLLGVQPYLFFTNYRQMSCLPAINKCLEILDAEKSKDHGIQEGISLDESLDIASGLLYRINPVLAISRIETKVLKHHILPFPGGHLQYSIQTRGNGPYIEMLESLMLKKPFYVSGMTLEYVFKSNEKWIGWCVKWKDDERAEWIVRTSLKSILNNVKPPSIENDSIRDRAISLVKEIAKRNKIDYDLEVNRIKEETEIIKALSVLEIIQNPMVEIDKNQLKENLASAPYTCKAFDTEWILNSNSRISHIFAYGDQETRKHIENVYSILDKFGVKIDKNKLQNEDSSWDTFCEDELISRLAPFFKVTREPSIKELPKKKLDIKIEFNGETALIELATVYDLRAVLLSDGGGVPGGKLKHALKAKLEGQLFNGQRDPGVPVFLAANLEGIMLDDWSTYDSIYGQYAMVIQFDNKNGIGKGAGATREPNGFYHLKGVKVVSGIIAYKRHLRGSDPQDPLVGRIFRNPTNPIHAVSQGFYLRLRHAIYGTNETSEKDSLLMVSGINPDLVGRLYDAGIEDTGVLALIDVSEYHVDGITNEDLKKLQDAARVVLSSKIAQ